METTTDNRAKTLDKVRKLLAKAASTGYGEEAKAFELKAEQLMQEYRIAEFELMQGDPKNMKYAPEVRDFSAHFPEAGNFSYEARQLLNLIAHHCGVLYYGWIAGQQDRYFGYAADLDYMDSMFTGLLLHMVNSIHPKPDPTKSEGENLYNLKEAGYKWEKIHTLMYPDVPWERRHGVRYTNVYKKYAEQHNLPRNPSTALDNYRKQFMDAYVVRIHGRLAELKRAAESTAGLVLVGRESDLKEAYYNQFPEKRPHARDCACSRCRPPKSTAVARTRGRGAVYAGPAHNQAAWAAGNRAANNADLGQTRIGGK